MLSCAKMVRYGPATANQVLHSANAAAMCMIKGWHQLITCGQSQTTKGLRPVQQITSQLIPRLTIGLFLDILMHKSRGQHSRVRPVVLGRADILYVPLIL